MLAYTSVFVVAMMVPTVHFLEVALPFVVLVQWVEAVRLGLLPVVVLELRQV